MDSFWNIIFEMVTVLGMIILFIIAFRGCNQSIEIEKLNQELKRIELDVVNINNNFYELQEKIRENEGLLNKEV